MIEIYRFRRRGRDGWLRTFRKIAEGLIKGAVLMALPLPATGLAVAFWYFVFNKYGVHFDPEVRDLVTAAWIPTFGVLYSLIAAVMIARVVDEHRMMKKAVNLEDQLEFMCYCDEEVSPLTHTLMTILASAVVFGFMSLKYPTFASGAFVVGGAAYLFALIYWFIVEYDDPLHGLWVIKSVNPEWTKVKPKEWRKQYHASKCPNSEVVALVDDKAA